MESMTAKSFSTVNSTGNRLPSFTFAWKGFDNPVFVVPGCNETHHVECRFISSAIVRVAWFKADLLIRYEYHPPS